MDLSPMRKLVRLCLLLVIILSLVGPKAYATHLFGADIFYTHISGNIYSVNMVIYGDCNGSPAAFNGLYTATPEVEVYNGSSLVQTIYLSATSTGIEVTPVCPSQINNTTCNGGSVPGVKQFIYSATISLSPSASWLFRFTGDFANNTLAGRSNTITNIVSGGQMNLEATLNNLTAPNSAPTYTTIPTPFFCINKPAQYNPGAVDPNNDSLSFSLVPGLLAGSTVSYVWPYTATSPLAVAAGSYSFSSLTGQLNFTPNLVQNALVVGKVEEYRNSVLVGTSMREMTFVVLNNCTNNPPGGSITNPVGGVALTPTSVRVCTGQGALSFNINPTDLDGDAITITTAGVPAGATLTITGNSTTAPSIFFSWNTTSITPGSYTFFVTYTDNGCPLSSRQTVAYTITVAPKPNFSYLLTQPATCTKKAVFQVTPSGTSPYTLTAYQGSSTVHTITNITGVQTDSLAPGTYTIRITDGNTCYKDTLITIAPPPVIVPGFTTTPPACFNTNNGSITASASGGLAPYQYALGTGAYSSNPTFSNLGGGTYTLHIKDLNDCIKDTIVVLQAPAAIIPSAIVKNSTCATLGNGQVTLSGSNGIAPYQYAVGAGAYSSSAVFSPLAAGTYVFHIKDNNGCVKDTLLTIVDSLNIIGTVAVSNVLCANQSNGSITVSPSGGASPYTFAIGAGTYSNSNIFNSLAAGTFILHIKDANGCVKDTPIVVTQPTPVTATATIVQPSCHGGSNGSITILGMGGIPGYTYALGAGTYGGTNNFQNLSAGSYTLHIKDNNNCIKDTVLTIGQPSALGVAVVVNDLKCHGDNSGVVVVTGTGGTPGYSYAVDAGAYSTSNSLGNLSAGTHIVHVKDNNGCIKDTAVMIAEPPILAFSSFAIVTPTCEGYTDGSITLGATGGTPPYQYSKNGTSYSSTPTMSQLTEGSYHFFVRDNNNCIIDTTLNLIGYPHIMVDGIDIKPVSCHGLSDGEISVAASGGNPILSYAIDNGTFSLNSKFDSLTSANHQIHIVDAKGCKKDTTVFVPSPQELSTNPVVTNNDCYGLDEDGKIQANVSGGTGPYSYMWNTNPVQTTEEAIHLGNGFYMVIVVDANNCTDSASAQVTYDDCCTVFVPDAFTPNNDGRNDAVRILYKGDMQLQQFSIYNRFGQRVFYTANMNDHWDGTFNGERQELGTYYYYLTVLCGNKRQKTTEFKGDITLIR
jgi:gliding motility-associated-like protein